MSRPMSTAFVHSSRPRSVRTQIGVYEVRFFPQVGRVSPPGGGSRTTTTVAYAGCRSTPAVQIARYLEMTVHQVFEIYILLPQYSIKVNFTAVCQYFSVFLTLVCIKLSIKKKRRDLFRKSIEKTSFYSRCSFRNIFINIFIDAIEYFRISLKKTVIFKKRKIRNQKE